MKVIVVKNNFVFFRYKCKTFGKSFLNSSEFIEHTSVSCQANKTWSLSEFPYRCECRNKPLILSNLALRVFKICYDPIKLETYGM